MRILTFVFLLGMANIGLTQKGVQFYAGVSSGINADQMMTPIGKTHNGIFLAIETRLRPKRKFSIIGGAKYQDVNFIADDEQEMFETDESMKWAKVRVGAMYKIISFSQSSCLRIKTYSTANILMHWPDEHPLAPYNKFNVVTTGAILGAGVDLFNFTIDFEYEIGFLDSITDVEGSTWNFWDLGIGYHF